MEYSVYYFGCQFFYKINVINKINLAINCIHTILYTACSINAYIYDISVSIKDTKKN